LLDESVPSGGNSPRPNSPLPGQGSPFRMPPFTFTQSGPVSPTLGTPSTPAAASTGRAILRPPAPSSPTPSPRTVLYITLLLGILSTGVSASSVSSPVLLLEPGKRTWSEETIGTFFSWLSTLLYLGSRLPQLIHNFHRRSTAGLSPTLFAAAFAGNSFYSLSLLSNPCLWHSFGKHGGHGWTRAPSDRTEWALRAAPFFLGAAGVLVMDAAMGVQFYLWGEGPAEGLGSEVLVVEESGARGPGRWTRVQGWMRGWMPAAAAQARMKRVVGERVSEFESDTEGGSEGGSESETESLMGGDDRSHYGAV